MWLPPSPHPGHGHCPPAPQRSSIPLSGSLRPLLLSQEKSSQELLLGRMGPHWPVTRQGITDALRMTGLHSQKLLV